MPEISRFFGITIGMNYIDHPPPHFHVRYGSQKAIVGIHALALLSSALSPRVLGLVIEWAAAHQAELQADWDLSRQQEPLRPIQLLE